MNKVPTAEINREFIKRINQGLEYLTEQIADIKLILGHLTSINSGLALRVTALESKELKKHE